MLRVPEEITHKGVKLSEALVAHKRWLNDEPGGEQLVWADADLGRANLFRANLVGAYLGHANLAGASLGRTNLANANLANANLANAYLSHAYLADADLTGANLADAYLADTTGNMREIKSAQFDTWPIAWTQSLDGQTTLQIGCERHDVELWRRSDPRWIDAMDQRATKWWAKYRDVVLALVDASPAVPYGQGSDT